MAQVRRKTSVLASLALALGATSLGWTQQAPASPARVVSQDTAAADASRTARQKLLAEEAQRLVAMATELKVEVDKTNKNILSLTVVRKAEQIEALAHQMKEQGKK